MREQEAFADLDEALRAELAARAGRVSIDGGAVLFEEGAEPDALYVLISGALTAATAGAEGEATRVAEFFAGETVGEMGVITGDARTATVTALRDSDLLRLGRDELTAAMRRSPELALAFARLVSRRLARSGRRIGGRGRPRSFALISCGEGPAPETLRRCFERHGPTALVRSADVPDPSAAVFQALETGNRHVLYWVQASGREPEGWARAVLRQSDEIVILAGEGGLLPPIEALAGTDGLLAGRRRHLVVTRASPRREGATPIVAADFVHHVAGEEDLARLVRILLRRAVGVALAGGGARAFAHVGALLALREAGIRPDVLVGTSMGAVVAAAHAMGWSHEDILARMSEAFVKTRPVGDLMWPWVALFRGDRVRRLLQTAFGDVRIEEMALPFACVTTDLTTGMGCLHRRGPLAEALRASVSIPGVFRPVLIDGHVHVDGAVVDNLPVAALRDLDVGPVIGLDIGQPVREGTRVPTIPGLIDVLWRTSTISGVASEEAYRSIADFYHRSAVGDYRLLDWRGFSRAVALGYGEAREAFAARSPELEALRASR